MGKAALDLPDPLQAAPGEARTSADDLLAQLAGDEIDRLLAEAEAGEPKAARAPFHVGPPANPKDEVEPAVAPPPAPADVTDVPSVTQAPEVPAEPEPPPVDVAAEMDALFSAAVAKDEADAAAAVAQGVAEAEAETSAAERSGLAAPAGVAGKAPARWATADEGDDDAPLPFYLRPLEWLNAPLAILPQPVRDVVGKIAIVTLLNAAAILAYVLVVRRMK
jgi:hypothetical protein